MYKIEQCILGIVNQSVDYNQVQVGRAVRKEILVVRPGSGCDGYSDKLNTSMQM